MDLVDVDGGVNRMPFVFSLYMAHEELGLRGAKRARQGDHRDIHEGIRESEMKEFLTTADGRNPSEDDFVVSSI